MKLTNSVFSEDYYNHDVNVPLVGGTPRLRRGLKKLARKARRSDAKKDIASRVRDIEAKQRDEK